MKHSPTVKSPPEEGDKLRVRRRFALRLSLIALAGFLLRLYVAWELSRINGGANNLVCPAVSTDMATYMDLARRIASGSYSGVFYYQPFYYTVFLPLIYICGGGVCSVVFAQALLGAATVVLVGLAGRRLFGDGGGFLSAALCAVSTPLLLYTPFHLNETLQAFNLMLLFCLLLAASRRRKWYWWAVCGAVFAVAVLTRGNALLLLIPVAATGIFAFIRARGGRGTMFVHALIFCVCMTAVELPFIWHNSAERGRLSGPSTAAGAVLALGNTPESPPGGREPGLPAGPMEYPESFHRMMKLQESGVSVPRQMWDWFRAEPAAFLELQFRKLLLFWDSREIPNNVSLYGEGRCSVVLRILFVGRSGVLITLALAGLLLMFPRLLKGERNLILLYAFILIYWFSIALFYNLSRFRAPILPLAAVAAGGVWSYMREAPPKGRRALRLTAALLAGGWICCCAYEFYRGYCEAAMLRLTRPRGTKIISAAGEPWVFDHGPLSFGGWREIRLTPGMTVEKSFGIPVGRGTLRIKVLAGEAGTLLLDCGSFALRSGENDLEMPASSADGRFGFRVLSAPPGASLAADVQRCYGRSRVDGETLPGELVCRFRPAL